MEEILKLDADALAARVIDIMGSDTWPSVEKAIAMVHEKHGGQLRQDGSDFRGHPFRVALYLCEVAGLKDANLVCAGLLHDMVEDTNADHADIEDDFGPKVGDIVRAMTWPIRKDGVDRSEHDLKLFEGMRWDDRDVQIVKSADRLDNIATIEGAFCDEHRDAYLATTRQGMLPLTLACNTALYHALNNALTARGCPE